MPFFLCEMERPGNQYCKLKTSIELCKVEEMNDTCYNMNVVSTYYGSSLAVQKTDDLDGSFDYTMLENEIQEAYEEGEARKTFVENFACQEEHLRHITSIPLHHVQLIRHS